MSKIEYGREKLEKLTHIFTPKSASKINRKLTFLVLLVCVLGICLLSYFVFINQSIRLDESQSIWQSSHSLTGLLNTVALDVHVPLYHIILHFWLYYFGDGIAATRILSLLFFIATVPVIFLLARKLLSYRWALFTTVLFSFSPFLNWYGNEARMYTLLLLIASLNQLFFLRILKTNRGWFWFGLTSVIGVYSHYFFLFNLAAIGVYYILNRNKFKPGSFKKLIVVAALVLAALGPWLYYVYSLGSASGTRPNLPTPSTVDFFNVYSQFLFGFQSNYINTIVLSAWPIVMLIALAAVRKSKGVSPEISFMITMSSVPIILAYAVSLVVTPFFLSRYMVIATAPLLLVVTYLISRYRKKIALSFAALLIVLTVVTGYIQAVSSATPVKEDYKSAINKINQEITPQDLVVLSAPFTIYPVEYYYRGSAKIETIPLWNRSQPGAIPAFNEGTLEQDVKALNQNHRYIYLLLSQDQGYEDIVDEYYLTHFKMISKDEYSDGLTLYVYQVGYYTVPPISEASTLFQENSSTSD